MAVDERSRHRLYRKLEEILGSEAAGTLMDHLPPGGSSNLVTREVLKADLESLEHRLTARMEELGRRLVMWTSGMFVALAALAFAAGRFV